MTEHACESTNHDHHDCIGPLWQCASCGKWVCQQEGNDDAYFDWCDDCWHEKMKEEERHD